MTEEKLYIIKLYNGRWINLFLFVFFAINNSVHCTQYSIMNDSISTYYNVPHAYVEWTAGLFSLCYVLFFAPALYTTEKISLKETMILSSFLSTLGAWVKVFSVAPDRFVYAFIGQFLISTSYTFTFGVSARLIVAWFGVHESSRASALSLFGDQFGVAAGFILPVIMVPKISDMTVWETSLRNMHLSNASLSTLCLILIIFVFKNKPKNPPSIAQALKEEAEPETFSQALLKMARNRAFLQLLFWYSVCGALLRTISAVLAELISLNFPDSYGDAGRIGLLMNACSMVSTPIFGYFMDKMQKFRQVGIALSSGTFVSFLIFTVALKMNNIVYIYIMGIFFGIFVTSAYVNGIPIGIEISYPISEVKSSATMVFVRQLVSTILLALYGVVLRKYGDTTANSAISVLTFAGAVVCFLTPVKLNRQEAEKSASTKECKEFLPKNGSLEEKS